MSVNWLVCLLYLGTVLYAQHATGSSISLHRQARYEEVDKAEFDCSGRASGYFVHPTLCSAYYACVNGKAYKSECLPGLLYHQTTTYCEKADLVDCNRSTTVAMTTMTSTIGSTTVATMQPSMISTTQNPTTMASTTQSVAMTTTAATTMQPSMVSTTQKPTTIASTLMTTMAATTMKSTIMPSSTTRMTTKTSTLTTSPAPTKTTASTTIPTTKMTTQAPTTKANGKKVDCRHHPLGTLLRNPDDCNTYYECLTSGPVLLHCGPFTVFNVKFGVCDFKYHVPECDV